MIEGSEPFKRRSSERDSDQHRGALDCWESKE
jgi:hypothetical protein